VTLEIADGVRVKVQRFQVVSLMPKGHPEKRLIMLEYARWKYILVATVLVLAFIFALPNFFGEDAALQLARKDHTNIDAAAEQVVREVPDRAEGRLHQDLH
jgi:hypothetical protein